MLWPEILIPHSALSNVRLLTGNSHPKLAQSVAQKLSVKLMDCVVTAFGNTETRIKPGNNEENTFRGKDIFILQTEN